MRILVVDSEPSVSVGGSLHRGFRALGHDATFFDQTPWLGGYLRSWPLERFWRPFVRGPGLAGVNIALVAAAAAVRPELVVVVKGAALLPETIRALGRTGARLAVYSTDDYANPLNTPPRMVAALPEYDVVFTPRWFARDEFVALGARRVEPLPFGFDPGLHAPARQGGPLAGDVRDAAVFVGTWAPERAHLFAEAAGRHPLRIFGNGWAGRTPPSLAASLRHQAIYGSRMAEVVTAAAINVALLRKDNRDRTQMRTYEVPACAGFLLTERTDEHLALFEEDREAVFFSSPAEFEAQLDRWMPDAQGRRRVAEAGYLRLLSGGHTYRDRAASILRAFTTA